MTDDGKIQPVPRMASAIAMWVFLASLAMLFVASLLGYILIRINARTTDMLGTMKLPWTLMISTGLMLVASFTIDRAQAAIRRERHTRFRTYLTATLLFALAFLSVQAPAMATLWKQQRAISQKRQEEVIVAPLPTPSPDMTEEMITKARSNPFYGFVAFLILLHAAHVIGGVVAVGIVSYNAFHGKYDHENYAGVHNAVLYWHFLDVVWLVMYVVLSSLG